ncbi:MAG: UvrD-helicase domain-containing protein [Proteobacteria bacterium]|nr:UvrD-helicase domain-containing protein [Pseudomonadota bacterium]
MTRPYFNHSTEQLRAEYEHAASASDQKKLRLLLAELKHRKKPGARQLLAEVEGRLKGGVAAAQLALPLSGNGGSTPAKSKAVKSLSSKVSAPFDPPRSATSGPRKHSPPAKRSRKRPAHKPTSEQEEAVEAFLSGETLKINAYAGTGKTSTLELLAHATGNRGQYIAFNRSIVSEAREKFPDTVSCKTTHSLALSGTPREYRTNRDKLFGSVNANQLAEMLGIKKNWRVDGGFVLQPRSQGYLVLQTIKRFAQSADGEPLASHVPQHGSLLGAPKEVLKKVEEFALERARQVWERMLDPADQMPLGHDGYLKRWALTDPVISADYILLDEAQDTNPVVLGVLKKQAAQLIYVGDKYQQIYEWRGAVNAMQEIVTDRTTELTQSFRFGSQIAAAASQVLAMLDETTPLRGNPQISDRIGATLPDTILARTNATTITALINALEQDLKPHLVGDSSDLMKMLRGVEELRNGHPSDVPEFFGFNNWAEVIEFAKSGEGEHLLTFVNLVESKGERRLMWALNRSVDEDEADIVVSTAHKSKGREWGQVRLMDDFLKSKARTQPAPRSDRRPVAASANVDRQAGGLDPAELRLFYVAMTRAKREVEIPQNACDLLGIASSSRGVLPSPVTRSYIVEQLEPVPRSLPPPPSVTHARPAPPPVSAPLSAAKPERPRGLLGRLFGKKS